MEKGYSTQRRRDAEKNGEKAREPECAAEAETAEGHHWSMGTVSAREKLFTTETQRHREGRDRRLLRLPLGVDSEISIRERFSLCLCVSVVNWFSAVIPGRV